MTQPNLDDLWRAGKNPERLGLHRYLSTACTHDEHGQCRQTCKFCDGPCVCYCHTEEKA